MRLENDDWYTNNGELIQKFRYISSSIEKRNNDEQSEMNIQLRKMLKEEQD